MLHLPNLSGLRGRPASIGNVGFVKERLASRGPTHVDDASMALQHLILLFSPFFSISILVFSFFLFFPLPGRACWAWLGSIRPVWSGWASSSSFPLFSHFSLPSLSLSLQGLGLVELGWALILSLLLHGWIGLLFWPSWLVWQVLT